MRGFFTVLVDGANETMSRTVSVIGAGAMGYGFAVHFAVCGLDVTLIDHRESNLDLARTRIRDAVEVLSKHELTEWEPDAVVTDVDFTIDRAQGVADADVVLETVPETLELKREVFSALATQAPADSLLASNTSGIPITEIATGAPSAADRIVGCHWWFPPYLLEPVEVVRGAETSDETVERAVSFVESVDRRPIRVERDVPGFVWNRVQNAVVRECLHLVEEGVASAADVNAAIRDGYARRTAVVGPLETIDLAGVELFRTVAADLYPHLCTDTEPNALFDDLLADGRQGIETGRGFFDYDDSPEAQLARRDHRLAALSRCVEAFEE